MAVLHGFELFCRKMPVLFIPPLRIPILPEKIDRSVTPDGVPPNYESALAELEALVARMEGGALNLEDSLHAYRRGAVLVAYCQQQLEQVDQQVRVLDGETLKALDRAVVRGSEADDDDA